MKTCTVYAYGTGLFLLSKNVMDFLLAFHGNNTTS